VRVGRAAEPDQLTAPLQLRGHRDGDGGLAAAVEIEDAVVDRLVRGTVEVVRAQDLDDVGDRVLGQQHPAEDGLLGRQVLRRLTLKMLRIHRLGIRPRAWLPSRHP